MGGLGRRVKDRERIAFLVPIAGARRQLSSSYPTPERILDTKKPVALRSAPASPGQHPPIHTNSSSQLMRTPQTGQHS